jgi:hypothetical protein
MRGLFFFSLSAVVSVSSVLRAQSPGDTLSMLKTGNKYDYFQGDQEVRFLDLSGIIHPNQVALKHMKYAKNNYALGNVFLGLGLITFGYGCLGYLDTGDKVKIASGIIAGTIVGGSMVLISIPLHHGKNKYTRKAIAVYNAGVN